MSTSFKGSWVFEKEHTGSSFLLECERIVKDESLFNVFKQNKVFGNVIGNDLLPESTVRELYSILMENPLLLDKIERFKTNDAIGGPPLHNLPLLGGISSGTLMFLNVLSQLNHHFGDITPFKIVEIGGGYGGQAKILLDHGVSSYKIIDVPQTLSLSRKYINMFSYPNITFEDTSHITSHSFDLCISNWCLSEFDPEGISFYIENVVKHCDRGFFLMNTWDDRKSFILQEMKKHFSEVSTFPEFPKTSVFANWTLVVSR